MADVHVSRRALRAVPAGLLAAALAIGAAGALEAHHGRADATPLPVSSPSAAAVVVTPSPAPVVPPVAALKARIPTAVLVTSSTALTSGQVKALLHATGATAALQVSSGTVHLGKGRTTALGVDPSTFRAWTPKGTAESNPAWQSVADGEAAVAHVVGRAFALPLGGTVAMAGASTARLRIGSFTTTGLPGIGLVVDQSRGTQLGLVPGSALLLSAPQRDAEVSSALAKQAVAGVSVTAVEQTQIRQSWIFPMTTGRITSPFGYRLHPIKHVVLFHDGIDIGAPLGTPIYAMSSGFVLYAGPASGFGQEVVLSHAGGVTTVYGHVSRILVTSGPVRVGQAIALVGDEGESTGPHLHAEVRVNDVPVDPVAWLKAHGVRF